MRVDKARFDALADAGFACDLEGDIFRTLYERGGAHYVDVGTSAKIAQKLVSANSSNQNLLTSKDTS